MAAPNAIGIVQLHVNKKSLQLSLEAFVAENLQSLNFFESDLGLAAAINDNTWGTLIGFKA